MSIFEYRPYLSATLSSIEHQRSNKNENHLDFVVWTLNNIYHKHFLQKCNVLKSHTQSFQNISSFKPWQQPQQHIPENPSAQPKYHRSFSSKSYYTHKNIIYICF